MGIIDELISVSNSFKYLEKANSETWKNKLLAAKGWVGREDRE